MTVLVSVEAVLGDAVVRQAGVNIRELPLAVACRVPRKVTISAHLS